MKRILLAGYGNIAHAFEKIMNEQEPQDSFKLTICDLKEGQDIFDFLPVTTMSSMWWSILRWPTA